MTSSHSSVIQFNDEPDSQSQLQFQDFTLGESSPGVATLSPSGTYSNFSDNTNPLDAESEDLLGTEKQQSSSFWKFSYYQSFFDVDTDQVVQRILYSMVPLPGRATFLDRQIRPKPDLYGPFWITATLIFSTAISANIADYLVSEGQSSKVWSYDFHKVSLAATAIYSYAFLLPIILWGLMWYRQSSNRYTLLEILCVYGYSLAIYVPISILWVIQVAWFQWILVIVGAALSGTVLIQTFWPIFKDDNKKIAAVVLCLMLLFHTLLAVGFVTYFFHPSSGVKDATSVTVKPTNAYVSTSMEELSRSIDKRNYAKITENHANPKTNSNTLKSYSLVSENAIKRNASNSIKTIDMNVHNQEDVTIHESFTKKM